VGPGFRDELLLVQLDGIAIGHARKEVAGGGVKALLVDRALVQELSGTLANLLPQASQDTARLLEFSRRDVVLIDRVEQETAQADGRLEHAVAHPNFSESPVEALHDDIGHHAADALGGACTEYLDAT